jgi:uncharacterized protein
VAAPAQARRPVGTASSRVDQVVLKVAELCNLNCSYCYMYNHGDQSFRGRPKFVAPELYTRMLDRMREHCEEFERHSMSLTLHGGEPTLIGRERIEEMVLEAHATLGDRLSHVTMQTNGTLLDDDWAAMLARVDVHVGVSIDGPAEVHDAERVDHGGRGSHARVMEALGTLRRAGIEPGVLCVINPEHSGLATYRFFREQGIRRLNFLLPDVSHDEKERLYGHLGPTPVADYLLPVFDDWFAEDDPSVRVRVFWGLLRMLLGGRRETDAFGNGRMSYVVVDTDGSIQPLDALRVCGEGIIETDMNVTTHAFSDVSAPGTLIGDAVSGRIPIPHACDGCHEREICAGGYLPHRYSHAAGFDNPSVWCHDILRLLAHLRAQIAPHVRDPG